MPPPSVNPPSPVLETSPPVVARPWACVAASNPAHFVPPPATARRAVASTSTVVIADRSTTMPSSQVGEAGDAVRSAPDSHRQALARREANGPDNVVGAHGTHDYRRVL